MPSTVLAALVADKTYPDPYFGMNLRKIPGTTYPIGTIFAKQAMPKDSPFACSWWYRKEFSLPKELGKQRIWLHFDGINYRANVWINGSKVADASDVVGSYRTYDFDVTKFVGAGEENAVAVETFAPTENDLAMNWVDWNPAPPDKDMGLWDAAYLTTSGAVTVRYPEVVTHFTDASLKQANLSVIAEVANASDRTVSTKVEAAFDGIHVAQAVALRPGENRTVTFTPDQFPQLRISNPKVWWPHGLGPQALHTLTMRAVVGGIASDEQQSRFGIREITSELNKENYRLFRINGRKILIRGGGWAPDMLLRESQERLEAQFDYVREMGLNTIRLEGKLEPEDFFDLADERGVLVMAGWCCCSIWEEWSRWKPHDLEIATAQLRDQIMRLRGHASLLVWLNGSDEAPPEDVERAYENVLQAERWPNPQLSAASEKRTVVSGVSGTKMTGPYDYVPPSYWLEDKSNGGAYGFNTETSPGPAPVVEESLRKMMPASEIWPPNQYWSFHAASGRFQNLAAFDDAMKQMYGAPKNLDDYEKRAQAMTYEGERAMFEAYARNKYESTGVIQWMLNNAWPSLYWHLYDYYLQPSGGYFGAKKANELVHIQYSYDDRSVVVVNSLYRPLPGLKVTAQVFDWNLKPIFSRGTAINAASDSSTKIFMIPEFPQAAQPAVYFVKLTLRDSAEKLLSSNFYWLSSKPAEFNWFWTSYERTELYSYADLTELEQLPQIKLDVGAKSETIDSGPAVQVQLTNPSTHLAFQVRLKVSDKDGREVLPVFWDDNYLELMPGESRTIRARYPSWVTLKSGMQVRASGWNVDTVKVFLSSAPSKSTEPAKATR
ncbi:MAG TPA: glycoside hydrolase family 2 protein [Candidatus Acidoferrales bacterium]|nr:glycoside hydrolase family 2 protein [Candidatus Acidoferrales bacterium]